MVLGQLGLLATAIVIRIKSITFTCVKPVSILIVRVVSFLLGSFVLPIRVKNCVAASLFYLQTLLLG